jgi:hypothetical protein
MDINEGFCELYGILIGDGCLSKYRSQGKWHHVIRIDGNLKTDQHYYIYMKNLIKNVLGRDVKIKQREKYSLIYFMFHNKEFLYYMNRNFDFPIGKKGEIKIHESIARDKKLIKETLRGIFDTDGCIYFTKNNRGDERYYPIIEIVTYSKALINQLYQTLTELGLVVKIGHNGNSVKLNGKTQVEKWMAEIGSNNLDKRSKFEFWKKFGYCPKIEELSLKQRLERMKGDEPAAI